MKRVYFNDLKNTEKIEHCLGILEAQYGHRFERSHPYVSEMMHDLELQDPFIKNIEEESESKLFSHPYRNPYDGRKYFSHCSEIIDIDIVYGN